ncbi:MAG: hypothetical protein SGCHY_004210, partial [Lobulomycetales sp.]
MPVQLASKGIAAAIAVLGPNIAQSFIPAHPYTLGHTRIPPLPAHIPGEEDEAHAQSALAARERLEREFAMSYTPDRDLRLLRARVLESLQESRREARNVQK